MQGHICFVVCSMWQIAILIALEYLLVIVAYEIGIWKFFGFVRHLVPFMDVHLRCEQLPHDHGKAVHVRLLSQP